MALRIRLSRAGAKKRPFYRIVVADTRSPRDGRFIEKLGTYDPMLPRENPERVRLNVERIKHWLSHGAQPTERVARFLGAAEIIPMPPIPHRPKKSQPKAKAQERLKALAEKEAAAKAAASGEGAGAEAATPPPAGEGAGSTPGAESAEQGGGEQPESA